MKYRGFSFNINEAFWREMHKHIDNYNLVTTVDIHGKYRYSEIMITDDSFDMSTDYISSRRLIWGNLYIFKSYNTFKHEVNNYSKESKDKLIDNIDSFNGANNKDINRFNLFVFYNNLQRKIIYVTGFPMLDCDEDVKVLNSYQLKSKEILAKIPKNDYKHLIYIYSNDRIIPLDNLHLALFPKNSNQILIYFDTYNDIFDYPSCLLKNIMFNISNRIESKIRINLICIRELNGNYDQSYVYDIEIDRSFKKICKHNYGILTKTKMISNTSDTPTSTNILVLGLGSIGSAIIEKLITNMDKNINYTIVDNSTVSLDDLNGNLMYSQNDIGRYKTDIIKEFITLAVESMKISVNTHRTTIPTVGSFCSRNTKDIRDLDNIKNLIKESDIVFCNINNRRTMWIVTLLAKMFDKICITSSAGLGYEVIYQGTLGDEEVGFELGCSFCDNNSFENKSVNLPQLSMRKYTSEIAQHAFTLLTTKKTEETVENNQIIGNHCNHSEYSVQQLNDCIACSAHMQGKILENDKIMMNCLQSALFIISQSKIYD